MSTGKTGFSRGEKRLTAVRRAHQDFDVIRPWTEAMPGGHLEEGAAWTTRMQSIEAREQRILQFEAGLKNGGMMSDSGSIYDDACTTPS